MHAEVYLIRHAESVANLGQPTDDPASIPLSERGARQAAELAEGFAVSPGFIGYASFLRARDTAHALIARFPSSPHGVLPIHEFTYLSPMACRGTTPAQRASAVRDYWNKADPAYCDGGGAESFADFMARVEQTRQWIRGGCATSPILLVSHELFIRALIWRTQSPSLPMDASTMREFRTWQLGAGS